MNTPGVVASWLAVSVGGIGSGVRTGNGGPSVSKGLVMRFNRALAASAAALAAASSFAAGPDFTTLTTAVDFSTVGTAILAIGALMVVPKVVRWGTGRVLAMLGR